MKKGNLAKKFLALFLVASMSLCANATTAVAFKPGPILSARYFSPTVKNKDQQINGTCWDFAVIAALETYLKKYGLYKGNLSEQQIANLCSHNPSDYGWNNLKYNGNFVAALACLAAGLSPISECDCPYDYENIGFNQDLLNIQPLFLVDGIENVNHDIDSIKAAVAEYSAVAAIFIVNDTLNHAVAIVGWDDSTQSWLVKDSLKYPNNYVWMPYSTQFTDAICITYVRAFDNKSKRYQHDEYGVTGFYRDKNFAVANVFDFEGNEELESVMINSSSPDAQISLHLAPVLGNGAPNSDRSAWQHLYSGYVPYDGYFTFSLQNKIQLNKGKYAIIVQMEQTADSSVPRIGCMMPHENLTLGPNTPGKSFILLGNKFCDVTDLSHFNSIYGFSIKAITRQS